MKHRQRCTLLMALCAVMWSSGGVLTKMIDWNAFTIAGVRSLLAAVVIGIYMVAGRKRLVFNRRSLAICVSLAGMAFCYISATKFTTAANAIVLQYTAPIFLLVYQAFFQKKRFHKADYLVVAFTLGGIVLFFIDQLGGGTLLGNCIAILSGVCFAAYFLTTGGAEADTRISGLLLGNVLAAVVGTPTMFFFHTPFAVESVTAMLVLGIFQLGVPYVIYAKAAQHCPPLSCALLSALEVLLNPVWVFFVLGERPGPAALLGGVIVIVSVTAWTVWDGKRQPAAVAPGSGA